MLRALLKKLRNGRHSHLIDKIAVANGVLGGVALYPQLFSLLFGGSHEGLSWLTFMLIALNSAVWIAYAIHRRAPPLLVSSVCNFIAAAGILAFLAMK